MTGSRMLRRIGGGLIVLVAAFIFLFPILWMLAASLLPDTWLQQGFSAAGDGALAWTWENYRDVFERVHIDRHLFVSAAFCTVIVVVGAFVNSACGFAFARLEFPGRDMVFFVVTALIVIPYEVLVLPLFLLIGVEWQMMNTLPGLFLPYLAKAFNIYFMRQYFLSLPRALEDSARVDGASWFQIYWRIGLPLAGPALATCAVLDFTTHWSEYLWPLVITNKPEMETVQLGLGHFYTLPPVQWGDVMAYSVMATLPMLLIFGFAQRYLRLSLATSGMKG